MRMQQFGNTLPVWQPDLFTVQVLDNIPTGDGALDEALDGGIPKAAFTEILGDTTTAMRLLLNVVAELSKADRWVTLIAPPHVPYAPALKACGIDISRLRLVHPDTKDATLNAMEKALSAGTSEAVITWTEGLTEQQIQHVQTLAEEHNTTVLAMYGQNKCTEETPAALRLKLEAIEDGAKVDILKRQGGWPTGPIYLQWQAPLLDAANY